MRSPLYFVLVALALTQSCAVFASPNVQGWKTYKTANFVLFTTKDEQSVAPLLYEFEVFRATVFDALQLNADKPMLPVEIFLINDPADYSQIGINKVAGYFNDTVYGPRMVIGPQQYNGLSSKAILYHEYLHYVMRTTSAFRYPTWYSEGIAEYYSTLEIRDDHVIVGQATIRKSLNAGSIPAIDQVMRSNNTFEIKSAASRDEFYASSWLLAHFFTLSAVNGFPDYRPALEKYLLAYNQGSEHDQAFSSAFSIDMAELKIQLRRYLRKNRLNLARVPLPEVQSDYQVDDLSAAEISLELAYIAGLNSPEGKELLSLAIEGNNAAAMAQKALIAATNKQPNARQWLKRATAADTLTANGLATVARAYAMLAFNTPASRKKLLKKSKQYFNLALASGNEPQVDYYLPDVLWQLGEQQAAIDHVVVSVKSMPANLLVNYQAGKYMLKIDNHEYARYFLTNVVNWSQSTSLALSALRLMAKLPAE